MVYWKKWGKPDMGQMSLSDFEYSNRKKKTKREKFLKVMGEIMPWDEWVGAMKLSSMRSGRGRSVRD